MGSLDEKEEVVVGNYVLGIVGNDCKCIRCMQEMCNIVENEVSVAL